MIILHDVERLVLQEIADGARRESVALTLAFGIRQQDDLDWSKINAAILARWKPSGREYILRKAWSLVEGKENP